MREYRDDAISHVIGYASRQYGTAGLERAYNAELIGLASDPFGGLLDKFDATPATRWASRRPSTSGSSARRSRRSGDDHGAVVMLDPTTGEVLALASTPTYDANAIADPDTAARGVRRAPRRRLGPAPAAGDAWAATCRARCSRS